MESISVRTHIPGNDVGFRFDTKARHTINVQPPITMESIGVPQELEKEIMSIVTGVFVEVAA